MAGFALVRAWVGTATASDDVMCDIIRPSVKSTSVPRKKKCPLLFIASGCLVVPCAFCSVCKCCANNRQDFTFLALLVSISRKNYIITVTKFLGS
jgi:hypothetical protein